jgi:hypothetical protein
MSMTEITADMEAIIKKAAARGRTVRSRSA